MRGRDPDELTDREREVLELLRRDFTNEQIAQSLGITLDGAKYHVSQILSKLGVATREAAAAVALGERRRWWATWPLWAKVAGAATVAAAAAGLAVLAVLAWGGLRTEDEEQGETVSDLTVDDLYARVEQAVSRPGFVMHSTVDTRRRDEDAVEAEFRQELWLDAVNDRARYEVRRVGIESGVEGTPTVFLLLGADSYARDSSGVVQRSEAETSDLCPGTNALFFSALLGCTLDEAAPPEAKLDVRVDSDTEYQGRRAVVLVIDESYSTQYYRDPQPLPTLENAPAMSETRNALQVYFGVDTFLPIARLNDNRIISRLDDGRISNEFQNTSVSTYEHEFLPVAELPAGFFEPTSLSYNRQGLPTP